MSIDTPRSPENNANGRFRRSLRLLFASSLLALLPTDTAINDAPVQDGDHDYLFEGIRILPPGSPKKPRQKNEDHNDEKEHNLRQKAPDFRIPTHSKLG